MENIGSIRNFALIGAADYLARRHMQASRDTANKLIAPLDSNDSVGVLYLCGEVPRCTATGQRYRLSQGLVDLIEE